MLDAFRTEFRLQINALPTKATLWGMIATVVTVSLAMIAVFVSVLAYLQDQRIAGSPNTSQNPVHVTIQQLPPQVQLPRTPATPQPDPPRQ